MKCPRCSKAIKKSDTKHPDCGWGYDAEGAEKQRQDQHQLDKRMAEKQVENRAFMDKHGLKTSADVSAFMRRKLKDFGRPGKRDRRWFIANWVKVLENPQTSMAARELAKEALANLHAGEAEIRAAASRIPGEDDERAAA